MLRHYISIYQESCQSPKFFFKVLLCILLGLPFHNTMAQPSEKNFTIRLEQIEYIDEQTQELTHVDLENNQTELMLSRNYNHIFVAMDDDHTIQYQYKVSGEAGLSEWKKTSHELHLVGLGRGKHKLFIRGVRNGSISSNTLQFSLYVNTPIYLRWWFISLILLVVITIFYLFLALEAKLIKERKDRNLQVSNLEAKAYRAQMNPHFIFNALNGMQTAMILGGEQEFNKYITSFSKLIRNTIEMSSVDRISIADEIAYITNYIDLQGHRLEQKIDLELYVSPVIDQKNVFLPCMMLQPIVENSIVHGIIPKEEKGKIAIDLIQENDMIKVSVVDNGIGREAAAKQKEKYIKHKSFATQIMRDRIDIFNYYNDRKLEFHIEDLYHEDSSAAGTKVTLYVPLQLKTRHK